MSRLRLMATAAGLSLLLAAGGLAREVARFGWNDTAGLQHLERELSRRVLDRARTLQALAQRVARDADLVVAATASPDRLPELFARLAQPPDMSETYSSTVWVPSGAAGGYRVLAWSDGPAEDVSADALTSAPALTVAPGAGGLRLVFVQPIAHGDRRVGVAAAETVLAVAPAATSAPAFAVPSSVGPVQIRSTSSGDAAEPAAGRLIIRSAAGAPLLEAFVTPEQVAGARRTFRWRVATLALLPWVGWAFFSAVFLLDRRRDTRRAGAWMSWTALAVGVVIGAAALVVWLARQAGVPVGWIHAGQALTALAVAAMFPGGAWWRRWSRTPPAGAPVRWILEQLAGGALVAAALVSMAWLWRDRVSPTSLEKWQLPILAADLESIAELAAVLVGQIAVSWAVAGVLGVLAGRWHVSWRHAHGWVAAALWMAPPMLVAFLPGPLAPVPVVGAVSVAASAAAFGLLATSLRHQYRRTSEARRLVQRFGALLVPILVVYPLAASSADRATRALIERDYGPATAAAQRPEALRAVLTLAQQEIDRLPHLPSLLARRPGGEVSSQAAFAAWTGTVLSRNRVTSEIELYGADRVLVSRFSLNVPEFGALFQTGEYVWQGAGCEWAAFAEVERFGAGERRMLHAERGVCDAGGAFLGAIVVHIIPDYRALPFVSSANPYYDVLGGALRPGAGSRIADLQVVVYGWSLQPVFVSGRVAWPIDEDIDQQLYRSRVSFWRERSASGRRFHIYFMNDRLGVYALGYPAPTGLQHASRIAEAAAVLVGLFVIYLVGAAIFAPVFRRRPTALRKLFHEIRASFYRKLFLFFVLAAVGPVVLFAIAFGAYMTDRLRADVESEAASVVIVARRVFDELSAAQARPGQARLGPNDDVMVWIRQMVDQDVNLYEGPQLTATSQRDLFEAGLLPTRTPASVYRDVVLTRRPVSVAEDRIGTFEYLVAAAPVPDLGRDAVLTVPLALRQREIEREIDELTRGVLAGAVVLVLFAAALGASVAAKVSDPVARLSRATRLIAAGRLDERLVADTADELGRLVEDFNTMTEMLVAQRAELARANQLKAWAEMSRQVAHEIKNPLTPIQLAAEHLQRVHQDQGRPLGPVFDQCVATVLKQVRLLRQIASEFSTFASQPMPRLQSVPVADVIESVVDSYRLGLPAGLTIDVDASRGLPPVRTDRTLLARALTNLVENALQAMPAGGRLHLAAREDAGAVIIDVADTGVGMDAEAVTRAFEPYFSTKTGGSGLGLANARRNIEICAGTVTLASQPGRGTTVTITLPVDRPDARASG